MTSRTPYSFTRRHFCKTATAVAAGAALPRAALADTDFYKGKTVQLVVPFSAGGFYDIAGRIVARHLPNHIPGQPNVVVQNQPGAGGLSAANRLATSTPKDGLTIATVSRSIPQLYLCGDTNVQFDPLKLTWLGSLSSYADDAYLLVVNASSPVKNIDDARKIKLNLAGVGVGATNTTFALLAKELLKVNTDVVRGFPGANDIWLAMERGEIDGQVIDISAIMAARPQMWNEGKIRVLVQFARSTRMAELPDVPTGRELVTDPKDRAYLEFAENPFFMALPFAAPPDIPADRAAILENAFMKMAMTREFRAEMQLAGMKTSPVDGKAVRKVIEEAAKTPQDVRERLGKLIISK
jgi:tripartite-type tricarboxylate transporter receptor subunit TctC